MNYVTIDKISDELLMLLKNQSLYPIIGAGFTAGCQAKDGKTPSGDELRQEMIDQISNAGHDVSTLSKMDLKQISNYYKSIVSRESRTKFLLKRFTNLILPDYSKKFLSINWKYVYTFNIDTAIEDNSQFRNVILPNKTGDDKYISQLCNCIFKIHGDVVDYCKYSDSECYIFDAKEYAQSISKNKYILNKFNHDFSYNNLIYIGCSLTDELDLLSLSTDNRLSKNTKRYYVTDTKPNAFKEIDLYNYGITDVILTDNYENFYNCFYSIFLESQKIVTDELSIFMNPSLNFIDSSFESNKDYFYLGKLLFNTKTRHLDIPNYFISRTVIEENLISEMGMYNMQFICGGRISGKSYSLISIAKTIRDRELYFFDSRYSLTQDSIDKLLTRKNIVICFDTSSLSKDQIFILKDNMFTLEKNNINIIICINRSDKDIISSIKKMSSYNTIALYELSNKFDPKECSAINEKLPQISLPNFDINKSILDNLLISSEINSSPYKECKDNFNISTKYSMITFILLAINEKLSSQEFVDFGIEREVYDILHKLTPIIDEDYTNIIERSTLNSSSYKIYANSRYWLLSKLGEYASDQQMHELIIDAYHLIIESLINNHSTNYRDLEDYIKYDVINEIFFRPVQGNLLLIKKLYDSLDDLLSSEPQFFHQKAKCYLWHCDYATDKLKEINDALRFAKLAKHNLSLNSNSNNNKVMISIAHMDFTIALIYAKINTIEEFQNDITFKESIHYVLTALTNPLNREYFIGLMKRKNKKINDINSFYLHITTQDLSSYHLNSAQKKELNDLTNYIFHIR